MLASRVRAAAQIGRAVYQRRHALPMPLQVRTLDCCCRVHAASPLKHSPLLRGLTSAASTAQPQTTKATTSDASDDTRTAPHQASAHTAAADGASSGGESHHSSSPPSSLFGRVLSALVLVPIFYLVNDQFFGISTVQGSSMSPTLNPGAVPGQPWASTRDVVLVWKFGRNRFAYRRGEVVVLTSPSNPRLRTTKRLIGLERDWIAEQGGSGAIHVVPPGRVWIEGDNALTSLDDSRRLGPIPLGLLGGRVTHILWPPSRIGRVETTLEPAGGEDRIRRRRQA